ncbi:hypothetical protein BDW75DRAFT_176249 [Aspergillus navahoensis]
MEAEFTPFWRLLQQLTYRPSATRSARKLRWSVLRQPRWPAAPKRRIPDLPEIQGVRKTHAAILPLASRRNERVRSACSEDHGSRIGHGCRRMQHWSAAPPDPPWGSERRIIRRRGRVLPHLGLPVSIHGGEAGGMLGTTISMRSSENEHLNSLLNPYNAECNSP